MLWNACGQLVAIVEWFGVRMVMRLRLVIILMIFGLPIWGRKHDRRQELLDLGRCRCNGRCGRLPEGKFCGTFAEFALDQVALVLEKVLIAVRGQLGRHDRRTEQRLGLLECGGSPADSADCG